MGNLRVINTGLDHHFINGVPIVEAKIPIEDVFERVARVSSLAVMGDPYFNQHSQAQKMFSELHGEGDRISMDFLKEGARDLLPIFTPFQRLIPEGAYDAKVYRDSKVGNTTTSTWTSPAPNIYIDFVEIVATKGYGTVTFVVNGVPLGTVTLPEESGSGGFLAYDLSGFLGGNAFISKYNHIENVRNSNVAHTIRIEVIDGSPDFTFDYAVVGSNYDAIGWVKALTEVGDVRVPSMNDNIRISHLFEDFTWRNTTKVQVVGVTVKHRSGSADVSINHDTSSTISLYSDTVGTNIVNEVSEISISLDNASDDFSYDLIINTLIPKLIPSPRFEFNSLWNPGMVIFRYQNMDSRPDGQKLNYTSETLKDVRVDPNVFDNVLNSLTDGLKNYVLRELYEAIGHERRAFEYSKKYDQSRSSAKFWVRSEKDIQTQYHYAGV